jgi:hypothetical protein
MIELTLEKAIELAKQAVADRGEDYVYEKPEDVEVCQYVHDDGPGCIVGYILNKAGASLEELHDHEGTWASALTDRLEVTGVLTASYEANVFLDAIQGKQDNGKNWGQALAYGLNCVK